MAPKTPLAERTPAYLAAYGRTLNAAYRFDRIQKEIADEQGRVQYLDSLIGQERQTLAGLQQVFRTEQVSFDTAQELLGNLSAAQRARALAEAQAGAARKAANTLSKDERSALIGAYAVNPAAGYNAAEALIVGATPEKAKAIIAALPSTASAADRQKLTEYAAKTATGKVPTGGGAAATAQGQAVSSALEAAFFAGPSGIRGGYDGMAVVERRKLTADQLEAQGRKAEAEALRKSGFGTQQDALNAALEEVRLTGDPAAIEDTFARDLYIEARNTQAYTNAERADFEQEVLDSRKRLANLESERRRIADAYEDPAQEGIKRELQARGYSFAPRGSEDEWKNRYVQYQNTPLYDTLLKADRLVDTAKRESKPLAPTTKAENMVTTLAMQYERTETPFDINTLRAQLEKAPDLSAAEVEDALGFIVAYRELGGEKQDPKQLEFLRKAEEFQRQSDEKRRQQAQAMQAEVDRARKVTRDLEAQQVRAVEELRAEQAALARKPAAVGRMVESVVRKDAAAYKKTYDDAFAVQYQRLRALGMNEDAAREVSHQSAKGLADEMNASLPLSTTRAAVDIMRPYIPDVEARPSGQTGVLMGADLALERAERIDAARLRPQDYVASPPASRIYDDVAAVPAEEELKFGGGVVVPAAAPSDRARAFVEPIIEGAASLEEAPKSPPARPRAKTQPKPKPQPAPTPAPVRTKVVKDPVTGKYVEVKE